jgi:hypothetical protein
MCPQTCPTRRGIEEGIFEMEVRWNDVYPGYPHHDDLVLQL